MEDHFEGDCVNNVAFGFAKSCTATDFASTEYEWIFWLSVVTATAFVALATPRVLYLRRCPSISRARIPAPTFVLAAKLTAGTVFAGLRLGLLLLDIQQTTNRDTRVLASEALDFAASCVLLVLSPLEHAKSYRPSILTTLFLFLSLLYGLLRCPALWSRYHDGDGYNATYTGLFTVAVVTEFVFLVLESVRRRRWLGWNAKDHSPEETSGTLSLGLYSWMMPLLWRGYHEPLTMQNLYALDKAISVETLDERATSSLSTESSGTSTWHLVLWLAKPLGRYVLLPVLPRLCLLGFTFCQPFFLQRLLRFLSSSEDDSSTASGLIAVALVTYSGIAISTALYWYYQERFQSLLRGFLIAAIYRKTNHILHTGDGDPASITLMGADVERIYTGLRLIHEVWANIIQLSLAAWLLQEQLGLAFLAPLVIVLFGFAGSFLLSRRAVRYQSTWMARVQARIGATSAILGRVKDLRTSGMTRPAAALVQHEREDEIRVGERSRVLIAVSASLSQLPHAVAPALAFAFGPHVLDETRAYTALSYLALLTAPLLVVQQSIPIIAACVACLRRIKLFLGQEERVDGRLFGQLDNITASDHPKMLGADKKGFIVVQDGSFGWTSGFFNLKHANLCLPKSSLTFVVGPVASGKSTLCRALLGEVPYAQGTVALGSDKVGYCDQAPFLFNTSIKSNIIGFSAFDAARYAEVIQVTMLTEDLSTLPAGDTTIIGSKGVSLSGGQRQRVALARALYQHTEILVLDDIFSGLDGSTQDMVCQSVFGPDGLLRRRGTTAIICTHSIHFVSVSDHIVSLAFDGTIAEQGSFAEITQDDQRVRRAGLAGVSLYKPKLNRAGRRTDEMAISTISTVDRAGVHKLPINSQLTPASVRAPMVDMDVYRHWLSTIGPLPIVLYLFLVIGVGFCSNFPTIWLKLWSADSVSPVPKHPFAFWIGIYALVGAGSILCVFPAGIIMLRTAVRLSGTDLHHTAVDTIMRSSLRFLTTTDIGKVLNLFSQDMNIMDTQLPRMVNNMCFCLATAIGQAVVIAISSAWLAVGYPFFIVLLWAVQRVYLPSSKQLRLLDLEAKTPLYTNFLDTLAGLPTIRAFGWFPHQLARNNQLLDESQRPSYLLAMAQQWLTLTMNVLVTILAVALVTLATQLGSDAGSVGAGLVTLITLGGTLTAIVVSYTGLETSLGAISRLKSFEEDTELESRDEKDFIPDRSWPMKGRVQFHGVDASYGGTARVLKGLTLELEAGDKIAICGRTGSGKSSILALLLRLIDPISLDSPNMADATSAPILIDGLPLNVMDRSILRERIISASQDPVFLPDGTSFRTNLDPWAVASETEQTAALRELGLAAVVEAKGGLDAPVSGAELSAGQKQLFSLARAVLRRRVKLRETNTDGGLLLLDEITSSADVETERRVRTLLEREFTGYTVVMVTHRQEMAVACDRVLVLDTGRVVEDGKPQELLQRDTGWFKDLWVE